MTASRADHGKRQPWWRRQPDSIPSVLAFALALFLAMSLLSRFVVQRDWNSALSFAAIFALVRFAIDLFMLRQRRR